MFDHLDMGHFPYVQGPEGHLWLFDSVSLQPTKRYGTVTNWLQSI